MWGESVGLLPGEVALAGVVGVSGLDQVGRLSSGLAHLMLFTLCLASSGYCVGV